MFPSLFRWIFGVLLGTGHCAAAKTQNATLHHVSGEEIASLIQINRGCGECLSDFSYINDVTCERTIGCTGCCGSHCKKMPLEKLPISQLIDGIPCKLCVVHSTPVIYTLGRSDGLGSRLSSIIFHLALAWKRSFSFGGVIYDAETSRMEEKEHKMHQMLSVLLGFDYEQLRPPLQRLHFGTCVSEGGGDVQLLQRLDQIPQKTENIFLAASHGAVDSVMTLDFLERWRAISGLREVPVKHYKDCGINIAMHVRRGDVNQTGPYRKRFIKDEVHIRVAQAVQAMLPHSCVHVFSTTFDHVYGEKTFGPSDFMKYHHAGFLVHLDNPQIEDMAHFANADVTICSRSEFCRSVSMLNPKCVLVERMGSRTPILNRIFYHRKTGTIEPEEQSNLYHCLQTHVLKVNNKTTG